MKAAITVWGERVSPVFDSARKMLIAEIANCRVTGRQYEPFDPDFPHRLIDHLAKLQVDVLLCGAISMIPSNTIELSGIHLISFISGDVDEILHACASGKPLIPKYLMPGCRCRYRNLRDRGDSITGKHSDFCRGAGCRTGGARAGKRGSGICNGSRQAIIRRTSSKNEQSD